MWPRHALNRLPVWITAERLLVMKSVDYFCSKGAGYFCREGESGSVRHDLELCALWWLTCQKPSSGREYWIFICKNRFLFPISHDARSLTAYMGDSQYSTVTSSSEVSVCFLRSLLDGLMHEFVILTERWIYRSLCLLLQWKWPLNVQCNFILDQQHPSDVRGGYLLPLLCDPWIYANLDSCAYTCVFVSIHVCKNMCMITFIYKLKIQYIWKHMFSLSVFSYLWGARNRCYLCWIRGVRQICRRLWFSFCFVIVTLLPNVVNMNTSEDKLESADDAVKVIRLDPKELLCCGSFSHWEERMFLII